jgi:hypothetical protein
LKLVVRARKKPMLEPGLDKHEWETQWQQFQEDLESSPAEALHEVDRLIAEMLEARGYEIDDTVVREGDDPEVVTEFFAAHETTRAVDEGGDVDPGDIGAAVESYRAIYEFLSSNRTAP